jgi:pimeloyl-ACP methyl ester carboxylesterase
MGGAIVLLLGEKYPELYDGVLDVVGLKDITAAYINCVTLINSPAFPFLPPDVQAFLLQAVVDYEAACGGTVDDKPKAYERISPTCHADISIPTISVHGAQDPMISPEQILSYVNAVDAAGCSEYYRVYVADPGGHADAPVQALALSVFDELVNYPDGW